MPCSCWTRILWFTAWMRDYLLLSHLPWDGNNVLANYKKNLWLVYDHLDHHSSLRNLLPTELDLLAFGTQFWDLMFPKDVAKIFIASCIWASVGLTMKQDKILTPNHLSRRVCLAKNRSDQVKFRHDVASANSSLSFALTKFWLTVTRIFSGLQLLILCLSNRASIQCSWSIPIYPAFLSTLIPRNHLSSPFSSISKFRLNFSFKHFFCSKSELETILMSKHTRTYIKTLSSSLTWRE